MLSHVVTSLVQTTVLRGMSRMVESLHPALSGSVLSALFKRSIFSCISFIRTNPELLAKITGLSFGQILEIKVGILTKYSSPLRFGNKFYHELINHSSILSTGIKSFDALLNCGLMTGNIYELCGFAGCGKTQICKTVSVNICQATEQQIFYIDGKNDTSARRFSQIAGCKGASNTDNILKKIHICHVRTAQDLLHELHQLESRLKNSKENDVGYKLIVIDSLSGLFQQFQTRSEGLCILNDVASILKSIAVEYQIVMLLTNFVKRWSEEVEAEEEEVFFSEVQQPALGKFWAHIPDVRIMIKKVDSLNECILTVLKSLTLPYGKSVKVKIVDEGVV